MTSTMPSLPKKPAATTPQIRPTKRRPYHAQNHDIPQPQGATTATTTTTTKFKEQQQLLLNDKELQDTRVRMESWIGLGQATSSPNTTTNSPKKTPSPSGNTQSTPQPALLLSSSTKSILKPPKYSKPAPSAKAPTPTPTTTKKAPPQEEKEDPSPKKQEAFICKNVIVERDPRLPSLKRKPKQKITNQSTPPPPQTTFESQILQQQQATSIEGYVPQALDPTTTTTTSSSSSLKKKPNNSAKQPSPKSPNDGKRVSFPSVASSPAVAAAEKTRTSENDNINNNNGDDNDDDIEEPLILKSFEDMMLAAGQLPDDKVTPDAQLVEANIEFSVMTQKQYHGKLSELQKEEQREREAQMAMFLGKDHVFDDEDDDDETDSDSKEKAHDNNDDDDDDEDDELLEMFMQQDLSDDEDDDTDGATTPQVRPFLLLWDALSKWITYEAVQWIKQLEEQDNNDNNPSNNSGSHPNNNNNNNNASYLMVDKSDIGASRCAGLMAMIKLYLPAMMNDLGYPRELRRTAEQRLGSLLRTFDYSREAPRLDIILWKVMTCIVLDMVLWSKKSTITTSPEPELRLPRVAQDVGMTLEEYRYLTRSTLQTFAAPV